MAGLFNYNGNVGDTIMTKRITRREFTKLTLTAAILPATGISIGSFQTAPPSGHFRYDRSVVIDNLASPGPFNVPGRMDSPLTDEMMSNSRKSGITAVNVTVNSGIGDKAFEQTVSSIGYWEREIAEHPEFLMKIRRVGDILKAKKDGKLGLIFGFQNTNMLGHDVNFLVTFHNLGIRIVQLTYNLKNSVGDGCLQPNAGGLTSFGKEVVNKMNEMGLLIDLSHCSTKTTHESILASDQPVSITHSGCKAVYDHPRSKRDEELKLMANRGGVIGIYMMPFLNANDQPTSEHLLAHIEHAVNVCGEDHVGIGSDLSITPHVVTDEYIAQHIKFAEIRNSAGIAAPREDEFFFVKDMNSALRMEMIGNKLLERGHSVDRVEKILGKNWERLFKEVW